MIFLPFALSHCKSFFSFFNVASSSYVFCSAFSAGSLEDVPPKSWYRRLLGPSSSRVSEKAKMKQFAFHHESDFLEFLCGAFHNFPASHEFLFEIILKNPPLGFLTTHKLHARRYLMKAWTSNKYALSLGIAIGWFVNNWAVADKREEQRNIIRMCPSRYDCWIWNYSIVFFTSSFFSAKI